MLMLQSHNLIFLVFQFRSSVHSFLLFSTLNKYSFQIEVIQSHTNALFCWLYGALTRTSKLYLPSAADGHVQKKTYIPGSKLVALLIRNFWLPWFVLYTSLMIKWCTNWKVQVIAICVFCFTCYLASISLQNVSIIFEEMGVLFDEIRDWEVSVHFCTTGCVYSMWSWLCGVVSLQS